LDSLVSEDGLLINPCVEKDVSMSDLENPKRESKSKMINDLFEEVVERPGILSKP